MTSEIAFHEIADLFPLMDGEEYEAFKADIQEHGLREPIWLHPDGRILDGRNRYRACRELGLEPQFRTWDGEGSLIAFVLSLNIHRRHLSSSQRAAVAVAVLPYLEAEAKERQRIHGHTAPGRSSDTGGNFATSVSGKARDQAAALMDVSGRYVSDAKRLKQTAPDIFERVVDGTMSLPEARALSQSPASEPTTVLEEIPAGVINAGSDTQCQTQEETPQVKLCVKIRDCLVIVGDARQLDLPCFNPEGYGVIIADPPWPYDNPQSHDSRRGGYTYSPMTLADIQAMPVSQLAAPDCILFLWGTWPKLPQVLQVMAAWGFAHVTGLPWIKTTQEGRPVYGLGYWIAGCSEYILIGRRGKVSPPATEHYLGLVGPALEHSRKPDDIHALAAQLPGPYLELFARRQRSGWTVFGNEETLLWASPGS